MLRLSTRCAAAMAALFVLPAALAQIPPGYYATVDASSAARLRSTLHDVIDDHRRYPYTSSATDTWDVLEHAWRDPADPSRVVDVYRNRSFRAPQDRVTGYNREHTWPRSQGFPIDRSDNYPFTDCHALMPCDTGYNSARSNRPYDTCSAACSEYPTDARGGSGGGSGSYPGRSNWGSGRYTAGTWQVWVGRRGDVARALLYLDVRYEGDRHGRTGHAEPDLVLTDDRSQIVVDSSRNLPVAWAGMLDTLLQWHAADPVDVAERHRNDVVYSYQGNRNPFVDHPEWVGVLWGGSVPGSFQRFGTGCAGSNGFVPDIGRLADPVIGSRLDVTLSLAPALRPAVLNFDLARRQIDLGPLGFPGCTARSLGYVALRIRSDAFGGGLATLPVPADPRLVGNLLIAQWVVLDPAGSGLAATPGAEFGIGRD